MSANTAHCGKKKKKFRLRLQKMPEVDCVLDKRLSASNFFFFFWCLTQELLLSQSLFPPLRLPHPEHNAQSPLQPFRNTIDYMVFTPLRTRGQGSSYVLKPKSRAHCPVKGEKAGGNPQPTFRGLIPAVKKEEAPPRSPKPTGIEPHRLRILKS